MYEDIESLIRRAIVIHRIILAFLLIVTLVNIVLGHSERKELQSELIINRQTIREMARQQLDAYSKQILREQEQQVQNESERYDVPLAPSPTPKVIVRTKTITRYRHSPTPRPWWDYFSK